MKKSLIDEIIGWYGAFALLLAYTANSFGFLNAASIPYQVLNLSGAVGIAYISLKKRTWQPALVNIIWGIIAITIIIKGVMR